MIKKVYEGSINYMQILDENGVVDKSLMPKEITGPLVIGMYRNMSLTRAVDSKVLSLQRQGRSYTYGPCIGEEATQIGSAMAMRKQDIFVPNFRQHGVFITRGMPLDRFFLYWKGYEDGNVIPKGVNGYPVIIPVSSQLPHAAGIAFAQRYMKRDSAVVTYVGDGGSSEGDTYEAMNFAGLFKVPCVFIIENNQWAISVPRKNQTAAETLAQKGVAAGIKNILQVDGNDVFAVYKAVSDAIAASSGGPTVIECVTYRMSMHTTSDDPTKYREQSEVDMWKQRDPLERLRKYMAANGLWNDNLQKEMEEQNIKVVDDAVEKAEAFKLDPRSMYQNVYSFMPQTLQEEMDEMLESSTAHTE
ncbi:MAG: pyruvate dehydrogenase (acetyl-transferring) E1 component subunit alpha [Candidatus Micrarchaeota archaeon]|nr:pyruvate dehydrogenase (acetyl-transferring) E1 component subunit alpha [Candidatus Micrarchaeota archaeon]